MPVNSILGVFAKSPIKPIQMHIDKVATCCELLIPFFKASHDQDWVEANKIREQISKCEKQASSSSMSCSGDIFSVTLVNPAKSVNSTLPLLTWSGATLRCVLSSSQILSGRILCSNRSLFSQASFKIDSKCSAVHD